MLDLRLPIAWFFLLNAAILLVAGLTGGKLSQLGSLSFNLNLVWGVVMAAFGAFMLLLVKLDRSKSKIDDASGDNS